MNTDIPILRCGFALMVLLMGGRAGAEVPANQRQEVAHLLAVVANTPCRIIRNGEAHGGAEAVAHIKRKYAYYRDEITNTEDFIDYAATKSSLSGRPYRIRCAGRPERTTGAWLMQVLKRYREKSPQ